MTETSPETRVQRPKPKLVRVVITRDNMSAMMAVSDPEHLGGEVTLDDVREEIVRAGVTHGIDWDAIKRVLDQRLYDVPTKIATGTPPRRGKDAAFEYAFEPETQHTPEESGDGRIDYRSINFIQNVREGTVLVRKIPPGDGEDGCGVDGRLIPGIRGRDFNFRQGKNTRVEPDGLSLVAAASGAIVFTRGTVSVNDVTRIEGDVDMSIGNINCIGSVRVVGDVRPGFTLNVGGNLEVGGNVADCTIRCEGNILIMGGAYGKGEGMIKADGDVLVKYAEGVNIISGNDVLVGDELLNCQVTAAERIIVRARKGKIIGGESNAGREIRVATAGNDAGTATILRVGYDAELMREYRCTGAEIARIEKDLARIRATLLTMYRLQAEGLLDPQRAEALGRLEEFVAAAPGELERLADVRYRLEERLREVAGAQIIVQDRLYHGVSAHFGVFYR